jgi:hypothetical protein
MHVTIVFPGALGDLCLLAPAIGALVRDGADVELSVQRVLTPVAAMLLPTVGLGPPADGAAMATLFAGEPDPALRRWLQRADRVHAWLARGDAGGGLGARLAELGLVATLHEVPRADGAWHAGDEYAAALAVVCPPPLHAVPLPATIALPWRRPESARLLVHPGAGARAKRWGRDGFRAVIDEWIAGGGEAAVLLGPAEEDDVGFWQSAGQPPLLGLALAEAAVLIASAEIWLGNDSGMSHLAGALGRRGVVVFAATRPERWRPLADGLTAIAAGGQPTAAVTRKVLAMLRSAAPAPCLDTPTRQH